MTLSGEEKVLLCCARLGSGEEPAGRIRSLLQTGLDWDDIVSKAQRHGVAPLLFDTVKKIQVNGAIPSAAMKRLEGIYYGNARRNMRLLEELVSLCGSLETSGLKAILLKGMAIADIVYKNISLRPISDIDVLIREDDFVKFRILLDTLGYRPASPLPHLNGFEAVKYAHYFEQLRFLNDNDTSVEVHFRVLNMGVPAADESSIWQRAIPHRIGDIEVLVPAPEDHLFHLCIHANQHNFTVLRFFCDISESVRHYGQDIEWDYFTAYVRSRGMRTSVYYTLLFTKELLGADVPSEVWTALRPNSIQRMKYELLWDRNNILRLQSPRRPSEIEAPLYYLLEIDTLRDKLQFLRRILFPPVEWLNHRYVTSAPANLYLQHFRSLASKAFHGLKPQEAISHM